MDIEKAQEYLYRRISPSESYADLVRYPRHVEIETVNACNARCPMCTIDDWERGSPTMKDDLFAKIATDLIAHKDEIKRVSLYRNGEPLLDKKMAARIALLKQGGIKQTSIASNVALLNEKTAVSLLEAGLDIIIMSIDSLKKDVYEGIRVRLNFEEVMENAQRFIQLRDRINPNTQIWMRMIRQDSNMDEWPQYEAFWKQRLAATDRIYHHNVFNWGGQLRDFKPIATSYEPNLPCVALWSLMVIFANGDVPLCNVDYNNKYPLGNVTEHSITELWQSALMAERRRMHMDGRKACISLCDNCNVWDESEDTEVLLSPLYAEKVQIGA